MFKDPLMSGSPEKIDWKSQPMREVNIETKGKVTTIESERGYPWREQLDRKEGKFLELAGPTPHFPLDILDFTKYRDNTVCTNLTMREGIDLIVDATGTPFKDGEFRAVLISAFRIREENRKHPHPAPGEPDQENAEEIAKVAKEAWRVLAPGGLLVWERLESEDELQSIEAAGFLPLYSKERFNSVDDTNHRYQVVFMKETE